MDENWNAEESWKTVVEKFQKSGFPVHQTHKTRNLEGNVAEWHQSWLDVGFPATVYDDDDMVADIATLSKVTGNPDFEKTFHGLSGIVQKSDFWRYAKLYLEGGLYADIDIIAYPGIMDLVQDFLQSDDEVIAFWENYWILGGVFFFLDTMVRYPQIRQCIMIVKGPSHPIFLSALEKIVKQSKTKSYLKFEGLAQTLELTGPGVYTDAVNEYFSSKEKSKHLVTIYRSQAPKYFKHVGTGTWKVEKPFLTTFWRIGSFTTGWVVVFLLCWLKFWKKKIVSMRKLSK